ncbi:MAG: 2-succinyl-5-enolpyruvyl-6-hydroxy-3-cyclohexene-1-carboxylic-acid synthase [Psittacicella sp.]
MDGMFNQIWSFVILETLIRQGVRHICIAPGSRSTPLTAMAAFLEENKQIKCHTHFDERGLGFYALGLSSLTKSKVGIIVTSGSATANLLPAIVEAKMSSIPLVVLTADRPIELIDCGANQAVDQVNMYSSFVSSSLNLPNPTREIKASYLMSEISKVMLLQDNNLSPVHINVPFAEPLYFNNIPSIFKDIYLNDILVKKDVWYQKAPSLKTLATHPEWKHWSGKKGVIVIGKINKDKKNQKLISFASSLGWVVITDIQSSLEPKYPYMDICLGNKSIYNKLLEADIVVQFGSNFVNRRIQNFLADFQGEFWLVDEGFYPKDPARHNLTYFQSTPLAWLDYHTGLIEERELWAPEVKVFSDFISKCLTNVIKSNLEEVSIAFYLDKLLPDDGSLFLGNSLFIRLADAFTYLDGNYPVYANRGASGIDGLLATIAGQASGSKKPMLAVIGDTSALYDLNSFALLEKVKTPLVILVINNNGGSIFNMLPVKDDLRSRFYQMPHDIEFDKIAAMFHIPYYKPYTWVDLVSKMPKIHQRMGATIIEIKTVPGDSVKFYQDIVEKLSTAEITNSN